ncbi:hypothetical protein Tco_1416007, partial [Tanacetum coccineum]
KRKKRKGPFMWMKSKSRVVIEVGQTEAIKVSMANSWRAIMEDHRASMEAMRAESAQKHKELIDLLKKYVISIGLAKEVEEWEKWRDLM